MNENRNDYQKELKKRVTQFCEDNQCHPELTWTIFEMVRVEALASFMNGKQMRKQTDSVSSKGSALQNGKLKPVRH